jgi:hypothetical protein
VLIGAGVYLPARIAKAALVLAIVVAAFTWVFAQAFGGILASGATDVNSGPLLALLALAYWPLRTVPVTPATGPVVGEGSVTTEGSEGAAR